MGLSNTALLRALLIISEALWAQKYPTGTWLGWQSSCNYVYARHTPSILLFTVISHAYFKIIVLFGIWIIVQDTIKIEYTYIIMWHVRVCVHFFFYKRPVIDGMYLPVRALYLIMLVHVQWMCMFAQLYSRYMQIVSILSRYVFVCWPNLNGFGTMQVCADCPPPDATFLCMIILASFQLTFYNLDSTPLFLKFVEEFGVEMFENGSCVYGDASIA